MPSRTDTVGHTKAFIYPVMDHGGVKMLRQKADSYRHLSVLSRTRQPPDHDDRPNFEDRASRKRPGFKQSSPRSIAVGSM